MENVSDKPSRGRPAKHHSAAVRHVTAGTGYTNRTGVNRLLAATAVSILKRRLPADRYSWLWNGNDFKRVSVLTELGRVENEDEMVELAKIVFGSAPPMPAKVAIARIRAYRIGKRPEASQLGVYEVLRRAINQYIEEHPDVTDQMLLSAIESLAEGVRELPKPGFSAPELAPDAFPC